MLNWMTVTYCLILYTAFPYCYVLSLLDVLQFDQSRKRYIASLLDLRKAASKSMHSIRSARKKKNVC